MGYTKLNHLSDETKKMVITYKQIEQEETANWSVVEPGKDTRHVSTRERERSGSVVECLTQDRRAVGSSLTGVTALCP